MPLSTMAAIMLLIALASGLLDRSLQNPHIGRFQVFAFIVLAALLRIATVSFSPEYEVNAGCVFTACVLFAAAAAANGKNCLKAVAAAAVCALPAAALELILDQDAAAVLAALVPLAAAPILSSRPTLLLASALTPVFAAAFMMLFGLASDGYGTFELTGRMLDLQWLGILFVSLLPELLSTIKSRRVKSEL
ncbi:MAG: hypothetical protein IKO51_11385 [Clostridia bacterium]|nr:hypothetical protein [Clostridia bacterium]